MAGRPIDLFLESLEKSRLLSSKVFEIVKQRCEAANPEDVDPKQVAAALAKRGFITPWQAGQLLVGRNLFQVGKYRLLSFLGGGGMGEVFLAEHIVMRRWVALKVMKRAFSADPIATSRFAREIQAAAALNHPNIIHAYDGDVHNGLYYLAMEFAEGESLETRLGREDSLPVAEACEIARQAALGLEHARKQNMVHRDIKPANLLLTKDEEEKLVVKILDFGLARLVSEMRVDRLTQTGEVIGTADYVSPEQAQENRNTDIRSDLYSLGCTLFRMLTGKVPFEGKNKFMALLARINQDAPPPSKFRAEIPAGVDAIVNKLLQRDMEKRYQTPLSLADDLQRFCRRKESDSGKT